MGLLGFSAAFGLGCDRDGGLGAGSGGNFGAGFASSTGLGFSCGGDGAVCGEAGSEFFASSVSFKSIKLAAIGGGVSISTSGIDKKNPNPQIINSQTSAASGNGHHRRISLDLVLAILFCAIYVSRQSENAGRRRTGRGAWPARQRLAVRHYLRTQSTSVLSLRVTV